MGYEEINGSLYLIRQDGKRFSLEKPTSIDNLHLIFYGVIPTNNWRKMHGYPLRKKGKGRKKKEK